MKIRVHPALHQLRQTCRPSLIAGSVALAFFSFQSSPASAVGQLSSAQAGQIAAQVRNMSSAVKLGVGEDLAVRSYMINPQGQTIVRADQTYQGHRVWGSSAVIQSSAGASPKVLAQSLSSSPAPTKPATLSQAQAIAIAMKAMALNGASSPVQAELVVFPTKLHSSIKMMYDAAQHGYVFDRKNSVMTILPSDPYVWAYSVHIFAHNKLDGIREMNYIVDARTGAVLNSENGLRTLAPPNPTTQYPTDVATKGTGISQYNGTVSLDTTTHADGTSALVDISGRASAFNPYLNSGYVDINGNPILDANGNPITAIGLQTIAETHDGWAASWVSSNFWYDNNPLSSWGDGNQFVMFPYGGETSTNGQTAAVDAHYGMMTTWDFYKNIFLRNGVDNLGTSTTATVHVVAPIGGSPNGAPNAQMYYDAAYWSQYAFGMFYSDGTLNPGVDPTTGLATTPNPSGDNSLTSIDITGHEMTHGVTAAAANFDYSGESGGLNESTSDIMGQMIQAYAKRPAGADSTIPLSGNDWMMGAQIAAAPLRYFAKPSTDGSSADMWYSGINLLDVHYSSGPLNRMFYFLSQGASSSVAALNYSAYLPGGMTGIGNDQAARIWYKALTERLTNTAQYADARVGALAAAYDLYGPNSAQVAAVRSAFAAINVGNANEDASPRITISMAVAQPTGSPLNPWGSGYFLNMPIVSMGTTVKLQANVQNTTNTAVVWQAGGMAGAVNSPGYLKYGGVFGSDGSWTPDNDWGFHSMTVISNADPLQFAEGVVWVINADADADNEIDAIDLGSVALSWGLNETVRDSHSMVGDGWVDSTDVTAIVQAFVNAFGGV